MHSLRAVLPLGLLALVGSAALGCSGNTDPESPAESQSTSGLNEVWPSSTALEAEGYVRKGVSYFDSASAEHTTMWCVGAAAADRVCYFTRVDDGAGPRYEIYRYVHADGRIAYATHDGILGPVKPVSVAGEGHYPFEFLSAQITDFRCGGFVGECSVSGTMDVTRSSAHGTVSFSARAGSVENGVQSYSGTTSDRYGGALARTSLTFDKKGALRSWSFASRAGEDDLGSPVLYAQQAAEGTSNKWFLGYSQSGVAGCTQDRGLTVTVESTATFGKFSFGQASNVVRDASGHITSATESVVAQHKTLTASVIDGSAPGSVKLWSDSSSLDAARYRVYLQRDGSGPFYVVADRHGAGPISYNWEFAPHPTCKPQRMP